MALDSAANRGAAIHVGLMWLRPLPLPDGTVGDGDRQHVPGYYNAVAAAEAEAGGARQLLTLLVGR